MRIFIVDVHVAGRVVAFPGDEDVATPTDLSHLVMSPPEVMTVNLRVRDRFCPPNARIQPPPDDFTRPTVSHTRLMKGKLRAVGCNEMLAGQMSKCYLKAPRHSPSTTTIWVRALA